MALAVALPTGLGRAADTPAAVTKAGDQVKAEDGGTAPPADTLTMADVRVVATPLGDPVQDPPAPAPSQLLTTEVIDREDLEWQKPVSAEEIRVIRDSSSLIYGPPQLGGVTTGNSYGYGGVRNLLNEHYSTVVGYPDQGIFPYVGYVMRF